MNDKEKLAAIRKMVDAQAEDAGLWFRADTASEAYLQSQIRVLHGLIEGLTNDHPTQTT